MAQYFVGAIYALTLGLAWTHAVFQSWNYPKSYILFEIQIKHLPSFSSSDANVSGA
jgi:hypothetical protein